MSLKPNIISKLGVIVLSIVLLTGISFIPVLQVGVYAADSRNNYNNNKHLSNKIGLVLAK